MFVFFIADSLSISQAQSHNKRVQKRETIAQWFPTRVPRHPRVSGVARGLGQGGKTQLKGVHWPP